MEESIKIEEAIAKALKLDAVDPRTYSPLVLACLLYTSPIPRD